MPEKVDVKMDQNVPPSGEQIPLPGPSVLPVVLAVGIALLIVGLTVSHVLTVAGAIIFIVTLVLWIAGARREMGELPLDHD